jgi:hypothetical protein
MRALRAVHERRIMMRVSVFCHVVFGMVLLTSQSTLATTIVLQPRLDEGKDMSLYERTDIELSSSKSLYAINTGPPGPGRDDFASLVEFDLSSVPGGNIIAATFWLYENNAATFSFQHVSSELPNTIRVQPAATAWEENSVFYSTLPSALLGYDSAQVVDAPNKWFSWDVTAAVADWLSGEIDNNGFLITSAVEVRNGMFVVGSAFDASEQPNAPYLEIELVTSQSGDYDRDLDVDGADFLVWQRQTGANVMEYEGADGNGKYRGSRRLNHRARTSRDSHGRLPLSRSLRPTSPRCHGCHRRVDRCAHRIDCDGSDSPVYRELRGRRGELARLGQQSDQPRCFGRSRRDGRWVRFRRTSVFADGRP